MSLWISIVLPSGVLASTPPNIILLIADDMGWSDTGYNGNAFAKTPVLDEIAGKGIRFDYFYASGPSCCPGRYSILTGRTGLRGGINGTGHIRSNEVILPRALKKAGYVSAHFGKWHLGSGKSSPVSMGYDEAIWAQNLFELNAGFQLNDTKETVQTTGDSSVALAKIALEYVRKQTVLHKTFFITIGFSSPHMPYHSTPEFKALHTDRPAKEADFLGEISGLDAAVGEIRQELRRLGIEQNTLLWFVSDNGGVLKNSLDPGGKGKNKLGARTVALLEWPGRAAQPLTIKVPCSHVDIYPTLLELGGVTVPDQPVLDGISLNRILSGEIQSRPSPIGFMSWFRQEGLKQQFPNIDFIKDTQGVWLDGKYILTIEPAGYSGKEPVRLFDIFEDPGETTNLWQLLPEEVSRMRSALERWKESVFASYQALNSGNKSSSDELEKN